MKKTKKSENLKNLKETVKQFGEKGDTVLSLFSIKNDIGMMFSGEAFHLVQPLCRMILNGINSDNDGETVLTSALLVALFSALREDGEKGDVLRSILSKMLLVATLRDEKNLIKELMEGFNG